MSLTSYRAAPPRDKLYTSFEPGSKVILFSGYRPDEVRPLHNRLTVDFRPNGLLQPLDQVFIACLCCFFFETALLFEGFLPACCFIWLFLIKLFCLFGEDVLFVCLADLAATYSPVS